MAKSKRNIFIFLSALFVLYIAPLASKAATPRIDSLTVNEAVSHLFIYGQFGVFSGNVFVGSTPVIVESWSDKLIECVIPPSGPGSGGPVIVTNANGTSNIEMLTMWICHLDGESLAYRSCGRSDYDIYHFDLYWRLDLQQHLLLENSDNLTFVGTSACFKFEHYHHDTSVIDPGCNVGDQIIDLRDSIHSYPIQGRIGLSHHLLGLNQLPIVLTQYVVDPVPDLTNILLDSGFSLISKDFYSYYNEPGGHISVTSDTVIGVPPPRQSSNTPISTKKEFTVALRDNPIHSGTWLNINLSFPQTCKFEAVDILGNVVTSEEFQTNASSYNYYWNTASLAPGMYFYRLSASDGIATGKAIVLSK
jgi:hypothetical protein